MKVLITGGSGLLGKYLTQTRPAGSQVELTYYVNHIPGITMYQMDVCNPSQVGYVFNRVNPEVVIHCAAIGSVDYAEKNFTETYAVNVLGTRNIVKACKDNRIKLVYISTNAVYWGDNPPYSETSSQAPVNRYGSLKREAENIVRSSINWLIVRPYMLYGYPYPGSRLNWLNIILDKLRRDEVVKLVDDVYWQPTLAEDCAKAIWTIIGTEKVEESYNVAAHDIMSLYEFGLNIKEVFDIKKGTIEAIPSSALPDIAPRPKQTLYDTSKIEGLGIQLRTVKEGLESLR